MESGMFPEIRLYDMYTYMRFLSLPILLGIEPENELFRRESVSSDNRFSMVEGIVPVKSFWSRFNDSSEFIDWKRLEGMVPESLFKPRSSVFKRWRLANDVGIGPVRMLEAKER